MEQKSLVNLKATDIMETLGRNTVFEISHYGKSLCTVVPTINTIDDLYNVVDVLTQGEYLLVPKPHNKRELVKICQELEGQL